MTLEDCFRPETWLRLAAFVKVRPRGEAFPVRVKYDPRGQSWQIGSNPLTSDDGIVVCPARRGRGQAACRQDARDGRSIPPRGRGQSKRGLRADEVARQRAVDPRTQDFFRLVIEERKRTQRKDGTRRDRARPSRQGPQGTANAGSYGIFAEMNRKEQPGGRKVPVTVWNSDGAALRDESERPRKSPGRTAFRRWPR